MLRLNLLFCLLFFGIVSQAQKHEPVNTKTDRQEYKGYTIRLLPAASGTYGYTVLKGTERVIHQSRNPFTFSKTGVAKKEDAYKLAQWQIDQLATGRGTNNDNMAAREKDRKLPAAVAQRRHLRGKDVTLSNGRLSPEVAKQLQITITH